MTSDMAALERLIERFTTQLAARGMEVVRLETHISVVLLAGRHAWKFKKPVDFGFVDFSTAARRRHFCVRELELNRRFAPALYEGIEELHDAGTDAEPEYAVRMRRFDQCATLDHVVAAGAVSMDEIAAFARELATLHAALAVAPAASRYGEAALASAQILATLAPPLAGRLTQAFAARLADVVTRHAGDLAARRAQGHVRDCHGDLHLSNVVRHDGRLLAFDCIEFNDELRIIDTLADAAFLLMDLDFHRASELGHVFMNHYLEASGDYAGVVLLPLYLAYRSLIRAKVALLGAAPARVDRAQTHVALAARYLDPPGQPGLVLTHGLSGSGKSHAARELASAQGFVHLRSDVERRRLAGLALDAASGSTLGAGLYSSAQTAATYARLEELATRLLDAGFSVVVDAAFLTRAQRAPFIALARARGYPCHVLVCAAELATLRQRIERRRRQGTDASEATLEVLEAQRHCVEPPCDEEGAGLAPRAALAAQLGRGTLGRSRPGTPDSRYVPAAECAGPP